MSIYDAGVATTLAQVYTLMLRETKNIKKTDRISPQDFRMCGGIRKKKSKDYSKYRMWKTALRNMRQVIKQKKPMYLCPDNNPKEKTIGKKRITGMLELSQEFVSKDPTWDDTDDEDIDDLDDHSGSDEEDDVIPEEEDDDDDADDDADGGGGEAEDDDEEEADDEYRGEDDDEEEDGDEEDGEEEDGDEEDGEEAE